MNDTKFGCTGAHARHYHDKQNSNCGFHVGNLAGIDPAEKRATNDSSLCLVFLVGAVGIEPATSPV
jgi:hypothetical protein